MRAWGVFLSTLVAFGALAALTKSGLFIFPIIITLIGFAIWRMQFACPKCETPLLYERTGMYFSFPRSLGDRCRKCGWPTDKAP